MKKATKNQLFLMILAILSVALVTVGPVMAKSSKKPSSYSSAAAAASSMGHVPPAQEAPKAGRHDEKPGPAWKTVGGTVKQIESNAYTVEDYEGNQVKLYVGQGTKHMRGQKKVGDTVRAEITRGGFANSIQ